MILKIEKGVRLNHLAVIFRMIMNDVSKTR